MLRTPVPVDLLSLPVCHAFSARWMLLAAGDFAARDYNFMTVSWGMIGIVWGKPCATVFVRPSRHTRQFMDRMDSFTLSLFPQELHKALVWCGEHSGRREDKVKGAGLTPIASQKISAPGFDEAELIMECRKIYFADLDPGAFLDPSIGSNYPAHSDYHRMFVGEIAAVSGAPQYQAPASS